MPWSSLLEVAYVGNQSRDILGPDNGGSGFSDINLVPVGAMLNNGVDPNGLNANNFRPLQGFADLASGHPQSLRQLQFDAGEVGAHPGRAGTST